MEFDPSQYEWKRKEPPGHWKRMRHRWYAVFAVVVTWWVLTHFGPAQAASGSCKPSPSASAHR